MAAPAPRRWSLFNDRDLGRRWESSVANADRAHLAMALPAKGQLRSSEGNINRGRIGEEKVARHRLPWNPGDPVQADPFRTVIADPENPVAELKVLLSDPDMVNFFFV